jgi:hypothetical protein
MHYLCLLIELEDLLALRQGFVGGHRHFGSGQLVFAILRIQLGSSDACSATSGKVYARTFACLHRASPYFAVVAQLRKNFG